MRKNFSIPSQNNNMNYESKIYDGVEVRRTDVYSNVWAAADGRVLGAKGNWLKPTLNKQTGYYQLGKTGANNAAGTATIHRIIATAWLPNPDGHSFIDHLSGVRTDNRSDNLKWCTKRQNHQNLKSHRENTGSSQYIGVCLDKRNGTWVAMVRVRSKNVYLGRFDNEQVAARTYDAALVALGLEPVNFKLPQ
jgi:HNH endonuclease/AP2 domain